MDCKSLLLGIICTPIRCLYCSLFLAVAFFWSGLFFCLIAHDLFVTTLAPY